MKSIYTSTALILSALMVSSGSHAQDDFPVLEGPYLAQKPPGLTAEPFAPGILLRQRVGKLTVPSHTT